MTVQEVVCFNILFEAEEMNDLSKACQDLTGIVNAMKKHNCDYLEGGYEDCPETVSLQELKAALSTLHNLIEADPTKMY